MLIFLITIMVMLFIMVILLITLTIAFARRFACAKFQLQRFKKYVILIICKNIIYKTALQTISFTDLLVRFKTINLLGDFTCKQTMQNCLCEQHRSQQKSRPVQGKNLATKIFGSNKYQQMLYIGIQKLTLTQFYKIFFLFIHDLGGSIFQKKCYQ